MKGLLTIIFMIVLLKYSFGAEEKAFKCHTFYNEMSVIVEGNQVALHKYNSSDREVASTQKAKTIKKPSGLSKTFYQDGLKHKLSIKNTESFNDVDDCLVVTNKDGHKMSYPLICESI
ncbi:MAG: hypothetical protein H6621_11965 [Halobacteriovoraceae bacterium]|nr:hypothetical protein [Halobacteriovoraceae bacterium]MCB9095777.1 hypothetical protein [Halobacteriovoraceae bacterium]